MKYIAMTRILDHLGRFTLPKEILYTCDFEPLDSVEFFIDTEKGTIILKKYIGQSCKFCQSTEGLSAFKDSLICNKCINMIKNAFKSKAKKPLTPKPVKDTETDRRALQPKEVMAQLLLNLLEKHPNATQQEYADMLRISQARVSQLKQIIEESGEDII
ncbi:hypothetical protein ASL14_11295 [Paenibacillus sp. IHB B 3084]|uniref:AbrB/MazE/SpoVT family DNA-binding domain-containing protein n=1 Tax=Paenibacillus TaxID=44249 RepID=UPI00071FF25C|nr:MULTISPECIES: AbrB/MazE/SpoVT family DNA-binding domain-containing protein [Paenibacillus]ALP36654.1 hypothetical protein ASL14_11295 [Paenibacillus sp. IHB B 3084]